jgi:adenylate cyclase
VLTYSERGNLPSIAVLPLRSPRSGSHDDDYFAAGVIEDIIMSLAGLRELLVISRGSSLSYRGFNADPRQVGRELGVRYMLRGTVEKSPRHVRVSAQLCEAASGAILWDEEAEVEYGELFDIQDRVVRKIVPRIAPQVRAAELRAALRKKPENFTAYDWTLRALHIINSLDELTFVQAREHLSRAIAEDSTFAMAIAWMARWYSLRIGQGWSHDPVEDAAKAVEFACKAIELDGQNALALATCGHLKSYLHHDYDSALIYFERALAACPNHSLAWLLSSATLSYVGRCEQAITHAEHALRLSPMDRSLFYYYSFLLLAHYGSGNYDEAVKWGMKSIRENPLYTTSYKILAASLAALDRTVEAHEMANALLKLEPNFRIGLWSRSRQPFRRPELGAKYVQHLRKSGLPE